MEIKFTKGEWYIDSSTDICTKEDIIGNVICLAPDICCEESLKNWVSNAQLISAAPDMFEQLTSIIDGTAFDKETGLIWEHRLEEIRKVLNKAVGSDSF